MKNAIKISTMKRTISLLSVVILSVMMISCGNKHETHLAEDTRPTVAVKLSTAGGIDHEGFFTVSGKIQAEKSVNVSAQMMGILTNVPVKIGDKVVAGQTLASINNTDIQAKIAQADAGILEAQTALKNLDKDYGRIKTLFDKGSATQKELDDISSGKEMMQAKVDQAQEMKREIQAMLSYSSVKAPFSGVITEKYVNSGDMASPGKPLFNLESGKNFQAQAMIPEHNFSSVQKGDKVKVVIKSNRDEINGVIDELSQSSLNTGGQFMAKVNLDKADVKDLQLFSGMYVNVLVPEKENSEDTKKILVDKKILVQQGQLSGLYTVSDQQTAILRWVRLGRSYGDQIEILSGLTAGEKYISEAEGRLLNGVKVAIQ